MNPAGNPTLSSKLPGKSLSLRGALGLLVVACVFGFGWTGHALVAVAAGLVLTVLLIIFGDWVEETLIGEGRAGGSERRIRDILLSREVIFPCFLFLGLQAAGFADLALLWEVVKQKFDIIFLIFTFAVVAYGIKQSGFFRYAAYRVVEAGNGSTTRVILYLFVLCSIFTYFTSNDIVILVMTPIVLEICRQARIENARVLLISQFIAANTLSMGLLIGSPTNIIVGVEQNLDFWAYFNLMLVPSIFTLVVSFLVLWGLNRLLRKYFHRRWKYDFYYLLPALKDQPDFTREMFFWILGFLVLLAGVATVSHLGKPFWFVTGPATVITLSVLYLAGRGKQAKPLGECLNELPYQIFVFAVVFFVAAEILAARTGLDEWFAALMDRENLWRTSFLTLITTGGLVNVMNDLPAAAFLAQALSGVDPVHLGPVANDVVMQATLVALNIGCYVTPIGALAGIIWFHILEDREREDGKISGGRPVSEVPRRYDLVLFGGLHFLAVVVVVSILIPFMNLAGHLLLNVGGSGIAISPWFMWLGSLLVLAAVPGFYLVLRHEGVRLLYVRAFLTAASWVKILSRASALFFQIAVSIFVAVGSIWVIWEVERHIEGAELPDSFFDFLVWGAVFLGSGFEGEWFPSTPLGRILAGLLPIVPIFVIIRATQLIGDDSSLKRISREIAHGKIVTRNLVIVGYEHYMRGLVREVHGKKIRPPIFQVVVYGDEVPPTRWTDGTEFDDVSPEQTRLTFENIPIFIDDFRLVYADEIMLLYHGFDREFVKEFLEKIREKLNPGEEEDEMKDEERKLREKYFRDIGKGEDPEEIGGRLPRIYVWADRAPSIHEIGEEVHKLLIPLPVTLRPGDERGKRVDLAKWLVNVVAGTIHEKSWKKRRGEMEKISQKEHEIPLQLVERASGNREGSA